MHYDIVYIPGDDAYWVVDVDNEEFLEGPFTDPADAELELAAYLHDPPPENDLAP